MTISIHFFEEPFPLAALVMDREEFNALCDELGTIEISGSRIPPHAVQQFKNICIIPCVTRGNKTEYLFQRYDIPERIKHLSAIIRGTAPKMLGLPPSDFFKNN